ncbi:hypothetical protein TBLA_0G01590 [Henningerozyma blattae CBS 6284]|uniref:UDP-galactose transporter homolog 1 n=1 Tax=Henningerozyma blattae (strain ATCC 34711 / CBS 6284 / DSM 70876 / NBRC 10599 / NRRL Y-10934 / UCD 77-7) TaxID=1071380 RepID=I2H6V1_HENB6|nr:hypothetical protein TBLA_0G01590 [Tetrapisispora blattae CBS 6284]CCH62103.1 hypothetical protein TBLA_0G01590 [Tetrapisispora blattae CBS 6284]
MSPNTSTLIICTIGIYVSFLTWALIQEPLTTKRWPATELKFQAPNFIAIVQSIVAMTVGYLYLRSKNHKYRPYQLIRDYKKEMALISLTQSTSAPLAQYSLQYVDYLTYMLAKSCKIIPVLIVHLLLYRTPISAQKKTVALLITIGVTIFTVSDVKKPSSGFNTRGTPRELLGYILLGSSLLMDGLTNATQDKMMKASKKCLNDKENSHKIITGSHMMFALNFFILIWNSLYLMIYDRKQWSTAVYMLTHETKLYQYLLTYAICGAMGQCFIFYTLEQFGSVILVMITVTRKMMSMLLSIVAFGKNVAPIQWLGILIVFGGISWEAYTKKKALAVNRAKKNR